MPSYAACKPGHWRPPFLHINRFALRPGAPRTKERSGNLLHAHGWSCSCLMCDVRALVIGGASAPLGTEEARRFQVESCCGETGSGTGTGAFSGVQGRLNCIHIVDMCVFKVLCSCQDRSLGFNISGHHF